MSEFDDYGGLTSETGSVGGGSGTYAGDRGILFPEFDQWARQNNLIMKTSTNARQTKENGISETITIDADFNDGLFRPSSTILGNDYLPTVGDEHPTIAGCYLDDVAVKNYNGQPDHFRTTLSYKYPKNDDGKGGGTGGGGGDATDSTPLDEPFIINFTPNILQVLLKEDLDGVPIMNPNAEPYEMYGTKVRLDGVATWNQRDWDIEDTTKWTNVVNSDTWTVDDYKFDSNTILLHYVVGNVRFYTDEKGKRIKYNEMRASLSYNSEGWNNGIDDPNKVIQRQRGSFYYTMSDPAFRKHPIDRTTGDVQYDLDNGGFLLSKDITKPEATPPLFQEFRLYELKKFSFVDLQR